MGIEANDTRIANLVLGKLGAKKVSSIDDDLPRARVIKDVLDVYIQRELETHPWRFAIERVVLNPDATLPVFGQGKYFTLPEACVRVLWAGPPSWFDLYSATMPTQIVREGQRLVSEEATLGVVYTASGGDRTNWTALFLDAVACQVAFQVCEDITGVSTKKADMRREYTDTIAEAKRTQAIERKYLIQVTDPYIVTMRAR